MDRIAILGMIFASDEETPEEASESESIEREATQVA
jgi:hypothetical protein